MQSHQLPALVEPIPLKAQLPILGDRAFLPPNWAVTVMHMIWIHHYYMT